MIRRSTRRPRPVTPDAFAKLRSVNGTRGSNRPVERTGGEERDAACVTFHGKAPLGSRKSTRSARNGVNIRDGKFIGRYRVTRSGNGRIDAVSIGRDEMSRSRVS